MPSLFCFSLLFSTLYISLARPIPNNHLHNLNSSYIDHFLHKFGYLNNTYNSSNSDFKSAVSLYQSKHSLEVTGTLDSATLTQISTPRCGFKDTVTLNNTLSRFAYFPGSPRWSRESPIVLTYAISPRHIIDYIARDKVEAAVKRAFDRWARVIPVKFVHAKHYKAADVKLGFHSGDHGDGEPFDGVLGILAHAFSPENGRLHLDAAERWAVDFDEDDTKVAVDLESVVTHELGHVLGLGHSALKDAVMFPSLIPRTKKVDLTMDDVEGVQALYGSNPNFKISSLLESDYTSNSVASTGTNLIGIVWGLLILVCVYSVVHL